MSRFLLFKQMNRFVPLVMATTIPVINNQTNTTETAESDNNTRVTRFKKMLTAVISTVYYRNDTTKDGTQLMAKIASEDKIRAELSLDYSDRRKLNSALNEYQKIPLNICVIGQSCVGKSSFINAIRGINGNHPDAACTDVIDSTHQATPYEVAIHKDVRYWDVPSPGTERFPKETYLEAIEFDRYDTFIFLIRENVVEDDIWLMTEIEKVGKKFVLVVSKIDIDIEDRLRQGQAENITLAKIRAHVLEGLNTVKDVYLISNYLENFKRWDFPRLLNDVTCSVAQRKKEAVLTTLMNNSRKLIHNKAQKLRHRRWDVLAPFTGSTTIPMATIVSEATLYRKELGLDEVSLARKCDLHGLSADELETKHPELFKDAYELMGYVVESYEATKVAEKALSVVPIVGQLVASLVDDSVSYGMLEYLLSHFETAAANINDYIIKASKTIRRS